MTFSELVCQNAEITRVSGIMHNNTERDLYFVTIDVYLPHTKFSKRSQNDANKLVTQKFSQAITITQYWPNHTNFHHQTHTRVYA